TLVFENGEVREYHGGYDDWQRQRASSNLDPQAAMVVGAVDRQRSHGSPDRSNGESTRKLTYRERQELDALPVLIEQLELKIQGLHAEMAEPSFYQRDGSLISQAQANLKKLEAELSAAYGRWEALDS
ncbi:MAG TPA: ABC transporter ATP-binding protein, partial [Pirellulaceae bacterium]